MFEPTQNRPNGPPTEPRDTPDLPDELGSGRRTVLRGPRTPAGASAGNGSQFEVLVGPLRTGADYAH